MGPSKLWLPTLLVTVLLTHYADAQIERTMRHFCSGSSNARSLPHTADRFEDLRLIYQNCTRVFGNVELTWLNSTVLANRTIDFLDDIEEVKGYIFIYKVDTERISFKNLKIIWGDEQLEGLGSLYVEQNKLLKVISMPKLRSIDMGSVHVSSSPKLCHLHDTVQPDEILDFDRSRFNFQSVMADKYCAKKITTCHPSCNGACWGPGEEDCQSIYRSVCETAGYCPSRQCYEKKDANQTMSSMRCCHEQCAAGCTGPTSKDCIACANFMQCKNKGQPTQECECVDQCTSLRKYNKKTGESEVNPDGYYSMDNRHCEKECPVNRLVQDDICVEHCSPGMHYDPSLGDKKCRPCDGPCPKTCKFNANMLDAENIDELENCTEIEGNIRITTETFILHNGTGLPERVIQPLRPEQLDILKTVRFVSEFVYVAARDSPILSLSFLQNLELIEGRSVHGTRQALVVSMNDHLMSLGLRKLKKIDKGDVVISMNTDLCYTDSFDWKDIVTGPNSTITITKNRAENLCKIEKKQCHPSCDPAFGCWGGSDADCRQCKNLKQDGRCVDKCSSRFYENKSNMACEKCDSECDSCKGPERTDCLSCRTYKLYKKPGASSFELDDEAFVKEETESVSHLLNTDTTAGLLENTLPPSEQQSSFTQLTCVSECPASTADRSYFVQNAECKRCHKSCYGFGCDGPSNVPGPGGCKKCRYAQIDAPPVNGTIGAVNRCLYNSPKAKKLSVCENNELLEHFVGSSTHPSLVEEYECSPCEDECHTCLSKGNLRTYANTCKCKNYLVYWPNHKTGGVDERCVTNCTSFKGMFQDLSPPTYNKTFGEVTGVCRVCHPECHRFELHENKISCTGPTDYDCVKCSATAFKFNHSGVMRCVKNCTEIDKYTYYKDRTCNEEDLEKKDRIQRAILYCVIALFIVLVLIFGFLLWRRQKRLSKELEQEKVANNPEMPELIPMDLNGPRTVNKSKINLIPKQALSRSARELGSGAFGVVYAGCWMPTVNKTGKPTKVPVAIKVVRDPTGRAQSEMLDEATKMTMMRHENLLRIVGVCLSGDDLQLVTLLRPLGNLREFLQKHKGKLSGKELLQYSYQIASGMKYLADQRVVHRDLAARNVLVKNTQHVEITDFGLAKLIDIGADSVQVGEGKVAIKWLALEALEKQVYNTATDVWAFGVTVWEILTFGETPYVNKTPMMIKEFLLSGQRLEPPSNCSTELYKNLLDCWLPNPESRPTFAVLKEIFYKYCRAPWHFIIDHDEHNPMDLDNWSQRGLIEEILDETDFEDPQNYFESEPNTPGCTSNGDIFNPMGIRRMDSLGSQRYAQDPTTNRKEFGMAEDNYLVPNSHAAEMGATMYTPVVVDESGNSSLVESTGYYNEVKPGAEYINDTQPLKRSIRNSRDDRLSAIEEDDGAIEKESCL